MDNTALTALQDTCQNLVESGGDLFDWAWDEYTEMAMTRVDKAGRKKAMELLEKEFNQKWNYRKVQKAPAIMRDIVEDKGGLSPGQYFYFTNPEHDVLLVGAWWPWADRKNASLRVSLAPRVSEVKQEDLNYLLRKWLRL